MSSSAGGIAILIPAYFVCAGILVYTAVVSAVVGLNRTQTRISLAFGAACLCAAGYTAAVASYHLADSVDGATEAVRWAFDAAALFLVALTAFVALFTAMERIRVHVAAVAMPVAILIAANHLLPFGARWASVKDFSWLFLPWGEAIFIIQGVMSPWMIGFRIVLFATAAWVLWRLVTFHRNQKRVDALVLAGFIGALFAFSFQGVLLDLGIVKSFELVPFGMVGFAMLMAISLTMNLGAQNRTLRTRAQQLREAQERLDRAMDAANLALFEVEIDSGRVYLSESWALMLGRESAPTRTSVQELLEMVHPDERGKLWEVAMEAIKGEGETYEAEHRVRRDDGSWIWILSRARVVERDRNGHVVRMAGTNIDVTERKAAELRIHHLSTRDALTNLPNRASFAEAAAAMMNAEPRLAILSIGLDRFTIINDSLGHAAGDLVLRRIASRIAARVGERDLVARAGGDEFLVLVPRLAAPHEAAAHARSICEAIAAPLKVEGREVVVTASVGIAVHPDDGKTAGVLLRNADTALHDVKRASGNAVRFFAPHMNVDAQARLTSEMDMRRGLANGEFVVHYQPKIDLASGAVAGYEALVRWQHRELGLLPPSKFLGIAEDTGLILELGEHVLREACREAASWTALHHGGTIAVNVSAQQFRDPEFVARVGRALQSSGLEAKRLELEIVENAIMDHGPQTRGCLANLGEMGVNLAIDDFGTGYSSLGYLLRLPIDTVKIDRSFVEAAPASAEASTIVRTVISLAHGLGLKVVAEGVEREEQAAFLAGLGCDQAQGFWFGAPVPASSVTFDPDRIAGTRAGAAAPGMAA